MPKAWGGYSAPTARVPRTIFAHAHESGSSLFPPALNFNDVGLAYTLMPDNWNGLDGLYAWFWDDATEAKTVNITINIATCDEVFNTHTQTVNAIVVNIVANEYECLDLTTIFETVLANLSSRDMIQVLVTYASGDEPLSYFGIELQET